MNRIKKTKSHTADQPTKKKETPVVVYFWTFGLAILGYTLSNIGLSGLPHAYHWTTGILGGIAGFGIGWIWYRWRGDII
jgi:hypothetical protein